MSKLPSYCGRDQLGPLGQHDLVSSSHFEVHCNRVKVSCAVGVVFNALSELGIIMTRISALL